MPVLAEQPQASVPQASRSGCEGQSIYRFWANKRVKPEQILASHRGSVVERAHGEAVVLAIQETTDLNFSGLKQTRGLGFINQSPQQGINVHSCFALSGSGEPLGLLHQHTWSRDKRCGKRGERRKKRPVTKREGSGLRG